MAERTARKSVAARTQASSLRGRVDALPAPQVEALRRFYGAPQRWFLDDGGLVSFFPGTAGNAAETFHVDADGTTLLLRLESGAAQQSGLRWNDYAGRSRMLAWSLAHESQLMRLSNLLGMSLLPTEGGATDDDASALWLGFAIDDDVAEDALPPAPTRGALRVPTAWLARVLARAEPVYEDDPLPDLGHWLDLPAPVTVSFPGPTLDGGAWADLRPGDVIVAGDRRAPAFEARSSRRAWTVAPAANGWRVDSAARPSNHPPAHDLPFPERSKMTDADPSDDDPGDGADARADDRATRSLPVQVAFDIGQLELSLGDLASLQPGYVFALPAHLEGANVTIRANGRPVGRGEVVAIGDTLGVRLLSWH